MRGYEIAARARLPDSTWDFLAGGRGVAQRPGRHLGRGAALQGTVRPVRRLGGPGLAAGEPLRNPEALQAAARAGAVR
ncbi:hypothetical protein [Peterkaempfera sp. SMS 1(5)a]|uniref:hypothetical protein n=1 Tax=Peterkaempfera podocarpi TaxID=3232308 RepID=UPI00367038D3